VRAAIAQYLERVQSVAERRARSDAPYLQTEHETTCDWD